MKTTVEIRDELLQGARQLARRSGRPLRLVIEDGLRRVLAEETQTSQYTLPDCGVGDPDAADPLDAMTWQDVRASIYGDDAR